MPRELSASSRTRFLPLGFKPPSSFLTSYCHHRRRSGLRQFIGRAKPSTTPRRHLTRATSGSTGITAPVSSSGYCRWNRPSKSFPRCESSFYLGPGIGHPRDSLLMLTRANKVVDTRDATWETPPVMVMPPVQLRQPASPELGGTPELGRTSEPGGASVLREAPEPGGLDDFVSCPPTQLPQLGRGVFHQRRVTHPAESVGYGGGGERGSAGGENLSARGTTNASSGVYSP